MSDAVLDSARRLTEHAVAELRTVVDGLPAPALDWQPAGPETNSIAVLATHAMNATRALCQVAAGLPMPTRDRQAEFRATAGDAARLLEVIGELAADCFASLDSIAPEDWNASRSWIRGNGEVTEMSTAYAVMHAVEHLRGHVDQASLTRHLWEHRAERSG